MQHRQRGAVGRVVLVAGTAALGALGLATSVHAETVIPPAEAPLLVQGSTCIGMPCASGYQPTMLAELRNNDTPVVRLDQGNGGGYSPQIWDVAGNETNFFVRDVTNGSRLPFRIRPGAPTSSIDVAATGLVGFGTTAPDVGVDVQRSDGKAGIKVAETSTTTAARTLGELRNNGPVRVRMEDTGASVGWTLATTPGGAVTLTPDGPVALPSLVVAGHGDVSVAGVVQQTADPARQTEVESVDAAATLAAIRELSVQKFGLTGDASGAKHLSPEGAAFRSALGLGADDTVLAPGDVAAAALVGVQALAGEVDGLVGPTPALIGRVGQLEKQVGQLETHVGQPDERTDRQAIDLTALARQATLANSRFWRANRVQKELSEQVASLRRAKTSLTAQVSSLRTDNAKLHRRLAAIEAAIKRQR